MVQIMDGRALADKMQADLAQTVIKMKEQNQTVPGLVVLLVGDDPASQIYVRNKERSAAKVGIYSKIERLPKEITEAELIKQITYYNEDPSIHGILVQLPLPEHINEEQVLNAIDPKKDVDGFHPVNMGHLLSGHPTQLPCTPYGIMKLLAAYNISVAGKQALVIGRSNIVGKPIAQLLLMADATVTMAHSKTKNLKELAKQADILVVAIGKGHFITKDYIKDGAVVIDVGMNRDENGKLMGDVAFDEVAPLTSFITPVPKGVGPMTITMLLEQTVKNAQAQNLREAK